MRICLASLAYFWAPQRYTKEAARAKLMASEVATYNAHQAIQVVHRAQLTDLS